MQHPTNPNPTSNPTNVDGNPRYDDRATDIIARHIENDEELLDLARSIIQRAYADAEEAQQEDPTAITAPRADAADALREYFDEQNPLYEDGGVWLTLLDFALDRCDWYWIVDYQRRVMEENRAADLAEAEAEQADCPKCEGKGYQSFGPLNLNCDVCHGTGLVSSRIARPL